MELKKNALGFPALLAPFIAVLIFVFYTSVLTHTGSISLDYGDTSITAEQISMKHNSKERLYNDILEETSPRLTFSMLLNIYGACLVRGEDLYYEYYYDTSKENKIHDCMPEANPESIQSSFIEQYEQHLKNYINGIKFNTQDISLNLASKGNKLKLDINSTIQKNLREEDTIKSSRTYYNEVNIIQPKEILSSPINNPQELNIYENKIEECRLDYKNNRDEKINCYKEISKEKFKLEEDLKPEVKIDSQKDKDIIYIKFKIDREYFFKLAFKFEK